MSTMTRPLALTVSALTLLAGLLAGLIVGLLTPTAALAGEPPSRAGHTYKEFVPQQSDPKALRRAWRAWQRLGADDYVLRVQNYCFCLDRPPLETTVDGDEVTSVRYQGHVRELRRKGYDMDRMYLILRDAYAHADRLSVRYSQRGVPTRVLIDWELMMADEEANYSVQLRGLDD
jgi:hypothetical protein